MNILLTILYIWIGCGIIALLMVIIPDLFRKYKFIEFNLIGIIHCIGIVLFGPYGIFCITVSTYKHAVP